MRQAPHPSAPNPTALRNQLGQSRDLWLLLRYGAPARHHTRVAARRGSCVSPWGLGVRWRRLVSRRGRRQRAGGGVLDLGGGRGWMFAEVDVPPAAKKIPIGPARADRDLGVTPSQR